MRRHAPLARTVAVQPSGAGEASRPRYGILLSHLTTATGFPALHRAIASGALDDEDDINAEFDFGLERILDGIETLIRARAARSLKTSGASPAP